MQEGKERIMSWWWVKILIERGLDRYSRPSTDGILKTKETSIQSHFLLYSVRVKLLVKFKLAQILRLARIFGGALVSDVDTN